MCAAHVCAMVVGGRDAEANQKTLRGGLSAFHTVQVVERVDDVCTVLSVYGICLLACGN